MGDAVAERLVDEIGALEGQHRRRDRKRFYMQVDWREFDRARFVWNRTFLFSVDRFAAP